MGLWKSIFGSRSKPASPSNQVGESAGISAAKTEYEHRVSQIFQEFQDACEAFYSNRDPYAANAPDETAPHELIQAILDNANAAARLAFTEATGIHTNDSDRLDDALQEWEDAAEERLTNAEERISAKHEDRWAECHPDD